MTITADGGYKIALQVPAGSMDPPTELGEKAMWSVQHADNWKMPTRELHCRSLEVAQEVAYAMDWYLGGHELRTEIDAAGRADYVVSSRGYYHYVGA